MPTKTVFTILGFSHGSPLMLLLTHRHPKYRKHKASGQAIVMLNGKDIYLGPHGTKLSGAEYDRIIAEWLVRGKRSNFTSDLTFTELIADFLDHADKYYRRPDGTPGATGRGTPSRHLAAPHTRG